MKKLAGIGDDVMVDFGGESKRCTIVSMKVSGIGVKLVKRGRKVHTVDQSRISFDL